MNQSLYLALSKQACRLRTCNWWQAISVSGGDRAPWKFSRSKESRCVPVMPFHEKERGGVTLIRDAQRSCWRRISTWMTPTMLCWFLVNSTSLQAGKDPHPQSRNGFQLGLCSMCAPWYKVHEPLQPIAAMHNSLSQNELDCTQLFQGPALCWRWNSGSHPKSSSASLLSNAHRFTLYCNDPRSTPKQGDRQSEFQDLPKLNHWFRALYSITNFSTSPFPSNVGV